MPSILNYRYYHRYYNPIVMREGGISSKVECVRMVTNRDIRFFSIGWSSRETQKMHNSESLDDNLEECSEGLVEEYSSSNQDLDDYTEAEGDGDFFGQSYILEEHYTLLKSWGEPYVILVFCIVWCLVRLREGGLLFIPIWSDLCKCHYHRFSVYSFRISRRKYCPKQC